MGGHLDQDGSAVRLRSAHATPSDTGLEQNGPNDDPTTIESVEVKVTSYDGTLVPLSIVYPKGVDAGWLASDAALRLWRLRSLATPGFDPTDMAAYERGVVRAICHVRGGGEYGEEWHLAGKRPTKPNTWRDFIACAEYLIAKGYTSPAHLAGEGGSAGGILIGRAIEERPDLFAAAVVGVPPPTCCATRPPRTGGPTSPSSAARRPRQASARSMR